MEKIWKVEEEFLYVGIDIFLSVLLFFSWFKIWEICFYVGIIFKYVKSSESRINNR